MWGFNLFLFCGCLHNKSLQTCSKALFLREKKNHSLMWGWGEEILWEEILLLKDSEHQARVPKALQGPPVPPQDYPLAAKLGNSSLYLMVHCPGEPKMLIVFPTSPFNFLTNDYLLSFFCPLLFQFFHKLLFFHFYLLILISSYWWKGR